MYASDYSLGRHCSICGAAITDNNPDGIGFQCREVYQKARWKIFFESQERANSYNKPVTDILMIYFYSYHYKTKFRSAFRKEFFPSIVTQWREKGFITRRQKEIVIDWLLWKDCELTTYDNPIMARAKAKQQMIFDIWLYKNITPEESEHVESLANKLRH